MKKGQTNNLVYFIIGILAVGGTAGTIIYFSQAQIDAAYICTTNNFTGVFERFSASNKTAYITNTTTNVTKSYVCTNGVYIPLNDWCTINKIDCKAFIKEGAKVIDPSTVDEFGNPIVVNKTIIVDKAGKVSINGEEYKVECPGCEAAPKVKCICDKVTGCKLKECLI